MGNLIKITLCECGCGGTVKKYGGRFCQGHSGRVKTLPTKGLSRSEYRVEKENYKSIEEKNLPMCKCGCGKSVSKIGNKFIKSHYQKTKEAREKQRISIKNRHFSEEKISEIYKKISLSKIGKPSKLKGIPFTEEHKMNMRLTNGNKGRKKSKQEIKNIRNARMDFLKEHPERHPNRILANNRKNLSYPEKLCIEFLEENKIPFVSNKYVNGYFPDLIVNEKYVIEIDGEHWHKNDNINRKLKRKESILKEGYLTIDYISANNVINNLKNILIKYKII